MARCEKDHEALGVIPVGISMTYPRFWAGSVMCPRIEMLCPRPEINRYRDRKTGALTDRAAFARDYVERLDRIGVEPILAAFDEIAEQYPTRDSVLVCYEARREDCHRGLFASWLVGAMGWLIDEWVAPIEGDQLKMKLEVTL